MEILTTIETDDLYNIIKDYKNSNIETFFNDSKQDRYIFNLIFEKLLNYGYENYINNFLDAVYIKEIFICGFDELKELNNNVRSFYLKDDLYLIIEA